MKNSFDTLYAQFGKQLSQHVCKKVHHHDYCHDILQEVFLKIYTHQSRIEQADNISAYIVRLTNNAVIDYFRKQPKNNGGAQDLTDLWLEDEYTANDTSSLADCCLRDFINTMPPIYRDAIVKVELEGLKLRVFAETAGISLSNAKVRVQRAKQKLKQTILECCRHEFDAYGNLLNK